MPYTVADFLKSISPNNLTQGFGGYDQSFEQYTDPQGNVYTPTRGGEMNDITGYSGVRNINGDVVNVNYDQNGNIVSATGQPQTINGKQVVADYSPNGQISYRSYAGPESALQGFSPILGMAAAAFGIPQIVGSVIAPAASAATQAAIGGSLVGGGISAANGQNPLQGALLGGAASYLGNQFGGSSAPVDTGPTMADLTGSTQPLQGIEQYAAPVAQTPVAQTPAAQAPDVTPAVSQPSGTSLADLGAAAPVPQVAANPTLADLTGNTGGLTGLDPYASIPTDLGSGGGNVGTQPTSGYYNEINGQFVEDPNGPLQNPLTNETSGTNLSSMNGYGYDPNTNTWVTPQGESYTSSTSPNLKAGGTGADLYKSAGIGAAGTANAAGTAAAGGGLLNSLTSSPLGTAALINGAAGLINSGLTSKSINNALDIQNKAAQNASSTLKDIYNQQLGFVQPYQQAGAQGLNAISQNMPYLQHQFNAQDLAAGLAPNYDFMLQQGQMANQRAANLGGGAIGGNALQGLQKYTQDYAGNAYQNAFNNYQTQRNNIYNTLANIAGFGQTANNQAIGAGTNYGQQQTNLTTGLAAAQAGANVAQNQNTTNLIGNLANNVTLASLLGQKSSVG